VSPKELLLDAIRNQRTESVPWVPFVGSHGGALIGVDASTYLKSVEHIVAGVAAAVERYQPDGIPVTFDLQIEAEALGCELRWAPDHPPAVSSHILENISITDLALINETDARIPAILTATEKLRAQFSDLALYGLVTGPLTLATHLRGTNIFIEMMDNPGKTKTIIEFCGAVAKRMADFYIERGCDIIAIVDPMTSLIATDTFYDFITTEVSKIFTHIREQNRLSSFFVCGNAERNVEAMCQCGPDNISIDENISLQYVRAISSHYNISFGGNMKLAASFILGDENTARRDAIECLKLGGTKGFILAPGCDLPYEAKPENIEAVATLVRDPYQQQVAKQLIQSQPEQKTTKVLPDYSASPKIKIDVFTLDSTSCAPCQYMVDLIRKVTPRFTDQMEWQEHKIKDNAAIQLMAALGVKKIPTICIDGKPAFESIFPHLDDLMASIQEALANKQNR